MSDPYLPPELYVWIVSQDGEDRIRKWDIKPFPEATHACVQPRADTDLVKALEGEKKPRKDSYDAAIHIHNAAIDRAIEIVENHGKK